MAVLPPPVSSPGQDFSGGSLRTVGYAQVKITPSLARPVYLAGFGPNRLAQTIHDDLYARALALKAGRNTLVLTALDLIGFFRPHVQEVISRVQAAWRAGGYDGLDRPPPQVIIASTHTHHGPDTLGLWGATSFRSGIDPVYLDDLKAKLVDVILQALEHLRPIDGQKSVACPAPGLARNARDPGIVDDELAVVQFLDAEAHPVATLVDFPCHPEVLWDRNPHITSDYPWAMRREVEAGSGAPCIFFPGALGGMMTPDVKEHTFAAAEAMGVALAQRALAALETASVDPAPTLSVDKKEIVVPLTNILYKLAFWLKTLPDVRDRRGRVESEVNLVRIGAAWFLTVPGELLPALGLALKADLRAAGAPVAAIIGLANDELGYILPSESFHYPRNPFKPGAHYEETNSIGPDIGPQVLQAAQSLLSTGSQ